MGATEYPFPVAVKTGTSQAYHDAWTIAWSRDYLVGVFPLRFETPPAVVGAIAGLIIHGLPMDELDRYRPAIEAVSSNDVASVAQRHIRPGELAIVLVGDADAILPGLEGAAVGPITVEREELPGPGAPANA